MTSEFGRLPVQGATGSTVGFSSGQSASSGRFTDGREVPGINPNTRSELDLCRHVAEHELGQQGIHRPGADAVEPYGIIRPR